MTKEDLTPFYDSLAMELCGFSKDAGAGVYVWWADDITEIPIARWQPDFYLDQALICLDSWIANKPMDRSFSILNQRDKPVKVRLVDEHGDTYMWEAEGNAARVAICALLQAWRGKGKLQ